MIEEYLDFEMDCIEVDDFNDYKITNTSRKVNFKFHYTYKYIRTTFFLQTLSTKTQTTNLLSANTPRKRKLRQKINVKNQQIHRLKHKPEPPEIVISFDIFLKSNNIIIPKTLYTIIQTQLELHKSTRKCNRYSKPFKEFALTLYFMGPKAYRMLAKIFKLPSKRTLEKLTKNWPMDCGLNNLLFEALKYKVSQMPKLCRNCSICVDEMSIKTNLFYNISKDKIIGFSCTEKTEIKPAGNALVFMVQGIVKKWKQALAYYLVSTSCSGNKIFYYNIPSYTKFLIFFQEIY